MKKLFLTSLFIFLSYFAFAGNFSFPLNESSIRYQEPSPFMHYYLADNTAAIQAALSLGPLTLTPGVTYNVTSINIVNNMTATGAHINCTTTTGGCIIMNTAGKTYTGGEIKGQSDITNSTNGVYGLRVLANNCTISHVYLHQIPSYGILIGPYNNTTITDSQVKDTGFIGIYFSVTTASSGLTMLRDSVDRSMIPANVTNQTQGAFQIHGAIGGLISNCIVRHCYFKQAINPIDWTDECTEVRSATNCQIDSNRYVNGTIGLSVVGCTHITSKADTFSGQQLEAHEWAASTNCKVTNMIISGSLKDGLIADGYPGTPPDSYDTIVNTTLTTCARYSIYMYTGANNILVTGGTYTSSTAKASIYMQGASFLSLNSVTLNGANIGTTAIFTDTSPGSITVTGGIIENFTSKVLGIYSTTPTVTDNIIYTSVTISGTPSGFSTLLSGGATVGTHIYINNAPSSALFSGSYTQVLSNVLNAKHDTTITGKWLYSTTNTNCLTLNNCYNVTIVNCIIGQHDSLGNSNNGIFVYNGKNIIVRNCYFKNVKTGVLMDVVQTAKVDSNQFLNMKSGDCVRFVAVTGPNSSVSYNHCESIDKIGFPQDVIDIEGSSGVATSPIAVGFNWIRANIPKSTTGGAILLGNQQGNYQNATYNLIVSPGSYGIAIVGGNNNTLAFNKVFSPAHTGSAISNAAIIVNNTTPAKGACSTNFVNGNFINWYSDRTHAVYNYYMPGTCTVTATLPGTNILNSTITATILPTSIITTANPIP